MARDKVGEGRGGLGWKWSEEREEHARGGILISFSKRCRFQNVVNKVVKLCCKPNIFDFWAEKNNLR